MNHRDVVYTIGHSTLPIEVFLESLRNNSVRTLIEVRTIPRSRANPQYNQDSLKISLEENGIEYVHFPCLGGLRRPRKDSSNIGWKNLSFRGYADYMSTTEFEKCLQKLITLLSSGAGEGIVLMCAEALPWRCHRSLIADALLVRGFDVTHLMSNKVRRKHNLTSFAVVDGERIRYPGP
ncbi:MAG: DUF488 domain-containing protein [Thermoprotei archaeon]